MGDAESETPAEATTSDAIAPVVKELSEQIDFGTQGCIRRLKGAVHQRLDSNWYDESQICIAVLKRASGRLDPDVLIEEFASGISEFWINLGVFSSLVDTVDFQPRHIAKLEQALTPEIYRDLAINAYLETVKRWASEKPAYGEELLDLILSSEGSGVRRLHVTLLEGLGEAVRSGTYERQRFDRHLARSTEGADELKAGVAIVYPAFVDLAIATEDDYRQRLDAWIAPDVSDEVVGAAVRSILITMSRKRNGNAYLPFLRRAIADDRPITRFNLVAALRAVAELETQEARQLLFDVVPQLSSIPISYEGTIRELSWTLFALAQRHATLVMRILGEWAERSDDELPIWHSQRFLHVINHVPVEVLISNAVAWLAKSRRLEDVALRLLLDERRVKALPSSAIEQLTLAEVEMCALVLAWHDYRPEVAYLLSSLIRGALKRDDCKPLGQLFERLLAHVIANYPGNARNILYVVEDDKSAASRKLIRRMRRLIDQREVALKKVHELPDFFPSGDHQRIYDRFDREFRREIHRSDRLDDPGRFPLLSMLRPNEIQLLGGGSVLSTDPENFGAVQRLGQIRVETEWPQLQVVDPQSEQMRRIEQRTSIEDLRGRSGGEQHGD